VGKTSLAKSIAQATGREYTRISLGGVRDESEIRGHRRTYIGSMPGKIIQSMKKCGTVNPLILLDEIDKMGRDFRGDPASALLEVLDPEQNQAFNDHYMEVDYDISNVLFLCTANSYDIPEPLLDRMEIIDLSGYTEDEKVAIANNHIINRQLANHGLLPEHISSLNDDILRFIIQRYTREAGVRGLERQIGKVFRKIARHLNINAEKKSQEVDVAPTIDEDLVRQYLGVPKYKYRTVEKQNPPGVVSGLAWNSVGGDTLSIEAAAVYGKAGFKTTGNLKDVMRESIQAAYTFVRSQAPEFGIHPNIFDRRELHVHVPEGATPKDGPSAGIAMCTAIVSLLTGIPARSDLAMTGEITLTGRVLAIGGLKEKLLAAMRSGIKTVLIPKDNEKDLAEIPDNVKADLEIITVEKASDVLKHALTKKLIAIDWVEPPLDGVNIFASDDNSDNDMARYGTT
jgi:ATP-dependent Lon protease